MGMEARSFTATKIGSKIRSIEAVSVTPYYRETSLDSLREFEYAKQGSGDWKEYDTSPLALQAAGTFTRRPGNGSGCVERGLKLSQRVLL